MCTCCFSKIGKVSYIYKINIITSVFRWGMLVLFFAFFLLGFYFIVIFFPFMMSFSLYFGFDFWYMTEDKSEHQNNSLLKMVHVYMYNKALNHLLIWFIANMQIL